MKKIILNLVFITLSFHTIFGQCINNPSIQAGDINPAPLTPNIGGTLSFTFVDTYNDYPIDGNQPISITICLLSIAPANLSIADIGGTYASNFTWLYDPISNCFLGTQSADIIANVGGTITVDFVQTIVYECPDNQMGFLANIQPAPCMNGTNQTSDDNESVYTCVDESILPVVMLGFKGESKDCSNILNWTFESAENLSHFIIERSNNGVDFSNIDVKSGIGYGLEVQQMSYIDISNSPMEYYRLKIVDADGTFEYSNIIVIRNNCFDRNEGSLTIYPNPNPGINMNLDIISILEEEISIEILDLNGSIVSKYEDRVSEGLNNIKINLGSLSNATYLIRYTSASGLVITKKFVKISP